MSTAEIFTFTEHEQSVVEKKYTGVVKWFDSRGGFGFITVLKEQGSQSGKEIFVHYSALSTTLTGQYKYLVLGEYVEFVLAKADNEKYEFFAKDVSGIQGGNLMCESRKLFSLENSHPATNNGEKTDEMGEAKVKEPPTEVKTREERYRKRPVPKHVYQKPRNPRPTPTPTSTSTPLDDGYKLVVRKQKR